MTAVLLAHAGAPTAPHDVASAWTLDPAVVAVLLAGAWTYAVGWRRLRGTTAGRQALPRWRAWAFAGAVGSVVVALVSPLDAVAEALFGAHMFQHLLLTLALPPLLVLARPLLVGGAALRRSTRRALHAARASVPLRGWTSIRWAAAAAVAHTVTLWAWHVPVLYEAALGHDLVHAAEHTTLVAGALPLWWLVADARGRHANAAGVFALFAGVLQSGALASVFTFAERIWYPLHAAGAAGWGLSPFDDQQLAGGLMWFPGGAAYIAGGAVVFLRWLAADERRGMAEVLTE